MVAATCDDKVQTGVRLVLFIVCLLTCGPQVCGGQAGPRHRGVQHRVQGRRRRHHRQGLHAGG